MFALTVLAAALGAALLLAAGGAGHLRDRRALAAALDAQRLLPARVRAVVTLLIGPAAVLAGATAGVAWLAAPGRGAPAMALVSVFYGTLGLYTTVLRLRVPAAPCGCFGTPGPVTWVVVVRAWLFAAVAGAAVPVWPAAPEIPLGARLVVLVPAVLVALAGWWIAEIFGAAQPVRRPPALS